MFNCYTRIIALLAVLAVLAVLGALGLAPAAVAKNGPRFIQNHGTPGWEEGGSFVPQSTLDAFARLAAGQKYTAKVIMAPLSTANGYPNPGGTAILAGSLKSKPFGTGAVVDRITITGRPEPNVFTFKGTEVAFWALGTIRDRFTGTSTVRDDGTQDVVVNGRVTGGTARYRGATGEYKFEGTVPPGSTVLTGRSAGRTAY